MASRLAEALAKRLVPPASAEHVLGDLAECAPTTGRYLATLASILPRVVWSQVRRRATIGFILVNAIFSGLALVICLNLRGEPYFVDPWAALRAAVPLAIWVAGCALAAAYGPCDRPERWSGRMFFATAFATPGTAWAAGVPVGSVALALGAVAGLFLLLVFPVLKYGTPPPLTRETLPVHASLFQTMIRWRNAREALAAVAVVSFNVNNLFETADPLARTAQVILIAGAVFIVSFIYTRAGAKRVPEGADTAALLRFHLREIARQRDVLRAVPFWYLLPLVPGLVLSVVSKPVENGTMLAGAAAALGVVAVVFVVVGWMNRAGARFLDGQLQQVHALEERA